MVSEILVQEGETVEVGTVLARIGGEAGASAPAAPAPEPATQPAAEAANAPASEGQGASEDAQPLAPPTETVSAPSGAENGKSFVSPVVARIAAEHGIDPAQVPGSGSGGRVTKKDIQAFFDVRRPDDRDSSAGRTGDSRARCSPGAARSRAGCAGAGSRR